MSAQDYNENEIRAGRLTAQHLLGIFDVTRVDLPSEVRTFQRLKGLAVDGCAGPDTRAAAMRLPDTVLAPGPVCQPIRGGCWWSGNAFDPRPRSEGGHHGRDGFRGPKTNEGWPDSTDAMVCAVMAGTVIKVGWQSNGLWIRIDHGGGIESLSGHMNGSGLVAAGAKVVAGTELAPLWGRINPPHIHFEIRKDGKLIEPVRWLESAGAVALA